MKYPCVYIITNMKNGTLYIGVTSHLIQRILQHREKLIEGFSKRYDLTKLVWFEQFDDIRMAIAKEKTMKEWKRSWENRIDQSN